MLLGHETPTEDDLRRLVASAEDAYMITASGNLSDPRKRELLQVFARSFFKDVIESQELEEYQGIPQVLIDTLSYSTFALPPAGARPKGGPAAAVVEDDDDDVSEAGPQVPAGKGRKKTAVA
jgi:hypothetical protein